MQEGSGRRKYDRQFKEEAVKLAIEGRRSVSDVARSLGIHENLLHTWKLRHKEDPSGIFPGKGHVKPQDGELRRLQKENANLKEEREILKKRWPSSQNTPNEILVHGPEPLLAWGADDMPSNRSIKERVLRMEDTASEQ